MKPTHKQMALKASLLMILAANVSWHVSPKAFHAANFASNRELGASGSGSIPVRNSDAAPAAPANAAAKPAPIALKEGPKPDAPISAKTVSIKESTITQKFCAVDFKIHFKQKPGELVEAEISETSSDSVFLVARAKDEDDTVENIMNDEKKLAAWSNAIRPAAIAKMKNQGRSCDEPTAPPAVDPKADENAKRIARGIKNCTLDQDGHALKGRAARIECNLKRLENISLDRGDDADDEDTVDENGRVRRHRRDHRSALSEVIAALDPLENQMRDLLTNERTREDGEDLRDDVIYALEAVRDTASNSEDERQMNRLIDVLNKVYPIGERLDQTAELAASRMSQIDDSISNLQMSAVGANYMQQMMIARQIDSLRAQRQSLQYNLVNDPDMAKLRAYQQAGWISSTDLADFAGDYNSIVQPLTSNMPGGTQFATAPNNLAAGRSSIVDPRGVGLTTPAFPQINYGSLGLQNPGVVGANPMTMPQPVNTMPNQMPMSQPMVMQQPMMQPTQNGWQTTPAYNPYVMSSQPMRL